MEKRVRTNEMRHRRKNGIRQKEEWNEKKSRKPRNKKRSGEC